MKALVRSLSLVTLMAGIASFAFGANQTLKGTISDSMCGASHAKMMAEHKDSKMTDRDCALACVKGGGKFVVVADGKVYNVANQNLAALTQYAGQAVNVTGDVNRRFHPRVSRRSQHQNSLRLQA